MTQINQPVSSTSTGMNALHVCWSTQLCGKCFSVTESFLEQSVMQLCVIPRHFPGNKSCSTSHRWRQVTFKSMTCHQRCLQHLHPWIQNSLCIIKYSSSLQYAHTKMSTVSKARLLNRSDRCKLSPAPAPAAPAKSLLSEDSGVDHYC